MAQDSYVMEPYRSSRGENDPQVQLRNALLENDFEKFEELVINGAVDLEYVYPYPDDKTCLELAVLEPNKIEFVKLILQHMTSVVLRMTEPISDTPILLAVKNRNIEALDALLEFSSFFINCVDKEGNTPLYYATRNGDNDTVLKLLKNGAYVYDYSNKPPLADIDPRTLETFLDECIETNGKRPNERDYEININYSFFTTYLTSTTDPSSESPEAEVLLYMTRNEELMPLLKHPVITSFVYLKWDRISSLFYSNITFYSLLWLCLMFYIVLGYGVNKQHSKFVEAINILTYVGTCIGLILLIIREIFQLLVLPTRYFKSTENLMEIALICVMTAIVCNNSASESTKQQLSAIAILLSSVELVLLIGQFPTFSTNIVMLRTVSWNFFKFLLWYCILIIAFALSFYILFRRGEKQEDQKVSNPGQEEEEFFEDLGRSLFKTIIMMTGEFDAGSIKFSTFPVTSHIIFILFVFMVPIVLFNLLNGLAVSDTQAIRADAELLGHISRIKLISHYESVLFVKKYAHPLKRCSWLPSSLQELKIIKPHMMCIKPWRIFLLFPDYLPKYEITVKPNQDNRIVIPSYWKSDIEFSKSCYIGQCTSYLDRDIVKNAKMIINKRTCVSEFDEIKHTLSKFETKILNMENTLKKFLEKLETP
ncbi:transient receptor potential cation channel protein painless isoform X1 [Bicyclus anynana]|uniref:Transient receptor potential cation channel protein painless isoform X1 n=2 Tax=Bicyclus anynana TaxID=110368 RepID=A0A6J1NG39_BICAN|nr:transient receptor potential cation channel protein painless isoform X1 [Bicyclus anynana]